VACAGSGGLTEVYFARPAAGPPQRPVDYAIKVVRAERQGDPLAVRLLQREAQVGRSVSQTHLVPILDAQLQVPPCYLVMPRLAGAALDRVLSHVGPLSERQALWITRQVTEALAALHDAGWCHGDVKPANIVASREGHATLIDLGFALRHEESHFSRDRPAVGTLQYMAPEVVTSALRGGPPSDIYSLGITLFELLTGQPPFPEASPARLVEAHRREPLPDARHYQPALSHEVVRLLRQMTAKQPLRRPQSARELIERLIPLEIQAMDGLPPGPKAEAGRAEAFPPVTHLPRPSPPEGGLRRFADQGRPEAVAVE
jgi:serine/threonine-protein kinase